MKRPDVRYVLPETLHVGDLIRVKFTEDRGLTAYHEGVVGSIRAHGESRIVLTADGDVLLAYSTQTNWREKKSRVTLLRAAAVVSEPLF